MADITKCKGTDCPIKESCYRFTATENEILQAYFVDSPFKDGKCEMYWGEHANDLINHLKDIMNND
jgi:hypothetical protein